jgi:hypothetical protein
MGEQVRGGIMSIFSCPHVHWLNNSFLVGQPNMKSYWSKEDSFFHCPTISNIMARNHFMELWSCLHITNPRNYEHIQKGEPGYDKL